MNNNEAFGLGIAVGATMGLLFATFLIAAPLADQLGEHSKLIEQCEANKPRNIHCILSAVEEKN